MATPFQFVILKEKDQYIEKLTSSSLEEIFALVKEIHPEHQTLYKEGSPGHMSIFHTSFCDQNILAEGCARLRKDGWKIRIRRSSK